MSGISFKLRRDTGRSSMEASPAWQPHVVWNPRPRLSLSLCWRAIGDAMAADLISDQGGQSSICKRPFSTEKVLADVAGITTDLQQPQQHLTTTPAFNARRPNPLNGGVPGGLSSPSFPALDPKRAARSCTHTHNHHRSPQPNVFLDC